MARRKALQDARDERSKMSPQEIRLDVRNYIQNERDTILRKWMALEEAVKSEDYRREAFYQRKLREDTKNLPLSIQKFIGTLKKAVRNTIRYKGGTPYSIVRSLFLYWDADKSGEMSSDELKGCMDSLGVKMSARDRDEVVAYYDSGGVGGALGEREMNYHELLSDISIGEPNLVEDSTCVKDDGTDIELRYEEVKEMRPPKTQVIEQFLEATRYWVMFRMRVEGSTPYFHIRNLFQFYDYDYSNGLNWKELMKAATKGMKLAINETQAREIVRFYDFRGDGDMRCVRGA
jgi:Ca2+-binding EF-hand superfamily protein